MYWLATVICILKSRIQTSLQKSANMTEVHPQVNNIIHGRRELHTEKQLLHTMRDEPGLYIRKTSYSNVN
jgi:hypothetical protein